MNYKVSKYMQIVKYEEFYIVYNSLSGALFTLEKELYHQFNEFKSRVNDLSEHCNELFINLLKTRCLVEDTIDELDIIKFRYKRDVFLNNTLGLTINPTMDCNFQCWYCYETHKPSFMSKKVRENVIKYVENLIHKRKISGVNLNWFGGEPLMYFSEIVYPLSLKIKELCEYNKMPFTNSITTNGYLIDEQILSKLEEIKLYSYQITLDGAREQHDKTRILKDGNPTYLRIINNINLLCMKIEKAHVSLRINYQNEILKNIRNIKSDFNMNIRNKIMISFNRIWQTFLNETTVDHKMKNELDYFLDHGFQGKTAHYFKANTGHKCYADRWYQAVINYDGNVYKCTAKDFKVENRDGVLKNDGTIEWDTNKIIKRFAKANFENEKCLNCKLLPICTGPCSQKCFDNPEINEICHLRVSDFTIEDFIISKYESLLKDQCNKSKR